MPKNADWFADPNGPAWRTGERRTGPPLSYVGEKLGHGLECQHGIMHGLARAAACAPAPAPGAHDAARDGPSLEVLESAARIAFDYQLTAYLALYNMLGSKGGHEEVDRLARMTTTEFRRWLAFVEREGSVTGG